MALDQALNGPTTLAVRALSTTPERLFVTSDSNWKIPRKGVWIAPEGAAVRIGGSDVTTARGIPIQDGDSLWINFEQGNEWWIVAQTGTPNLQLTVIR